MTDKIRLQHIEGMAGYCPLCARMMEEIIHNHYRQQELRRVERKVVSK